MMSRVTIFALGFIVVSCTSDKSRNVCQEVLNMTLELLDGPEFVCKKSVKEEKDSFTTVIETGRDPRPRYAFELCKNSAEASWLQSEYDKLAAKNKKIKEKDIIEVTNMLPFSCSKRET